MKTPRETSLRFSKRMRFPYLNDFGFGKLGLVIFLSLKSWLNDTFFTSVSWGISSGLAKLESSFLGYALVSFADRVKSVVLMRTEKKMAWPHTSSVIAFVAYTKTFGDISVMKFIRNAMGAFSSSIYIYSSISTWITRTIPNPAGLCFFDVFPKADFNRGIRGHELIIA